MLPKYPKIFQNPSEKKNSINIIKIPKIHQNSIKLSRIHQNSIQFSEIPQNSIKFSEIHKKPKILSNLQKTHLFCVNPSICPVHAFWVISLTEPDKIQIYVNVKNLPNSFRYS